MTGGTGFLGSNLLKRLVYGDYRIILLLRSVSNIWRIRDSIKSVESVNLDEKRLEDTFNHKKIDIIIHCATNYGRKEIDDISILEANLILPLKLLQLGAKTGVSCFVNTDTVLDKRVSHYSLSKSHFKEWLNEYSQKMACINVALEHFYGPFDDESKFVSFIIRSIVNNVQDIDLTEGKQKRDFIYIDDVVDAFIKVIEFHRETKSGFYQYEIGTSRTTEIREFVSLVKQMSKNHSTRLNFGAIPYREHEVMESHVDISAITKLGWKPKYSLEEGLRKTIYLEKEYTCP